MYRMLVVAGFLFVTGCEEKQSTDTTDAGQCELDGEIIENGESWNCACNERDCVDGEIITTDMGCYETGTTTVYGHVGRCAPF